ncbi:transferase [Neiella marina]|uniref:Transferase n=1 Tax=Neiella marina TaxID=508461 RepID=A0A8J2XQT5_9GAMM|nr:acyltransferase [Neiella marina]GGA84160.1 transferase [Neiella marina]
MKQNLKHLLGWLAALVVSPLTISFLALKLLLKGRTPHFAGYSQFLSLFPGLIGSYIRYGFYRFTLTQCVADGVIGFGALFSQVDTDLGRGVYIGPQCNIGSCAIGANTLLGSGVHVMSGKGQHNFADLTTPIKDQGGALTKVNIGEDCWIGNGALILANVGNHCVVGAGSVVTQDLPDYSIAAGNPAKVIKQRNS